MFITTDDLNDVDKLLKDLDKFLYLFNTVYTKEFIFTGFEEEPEIIQKLFLEQYNEESLKSKLIYYSEQVSLIHSLIEMNSYGKYDKE